MRVHISKPEYDLLLESRDVVDMRDTTLSELIVIQGLWWKNKRQQLLYTEQDFEELVKGLLELKPLQK